MRLSKRSEYAIRALIEIALEEEMRPGAIFQLSAISTRANIPEKFLQQLVLVLRHAGYLKSRRGANGGYSLAKPAECISLGEIIRALDGPLAPIPCVGNTNRDVCSCPEVEACGLRIAMQQVGDAIVNILDNYQLNELIRDIKLTKHTFVL